MMLLIIIVSFCLLIIELIGISLKVLNRSMDPKTYEQNAPKPPLIAQIPPTISQMPMLPQHVITSGTEKNCIRLRGLPYEAKVEHILHFLEDFAKHIVYQGVHLVYNAQVSPMLYFVVKIIALPKTLCFKGQFNGEAFIQMDSETAAQASAQQKHHKHMMFGKKQRYIEVFQCSGEDMNMVLNGGGYQYPSQPVTAKPISSSGMLPSRPQQQAQPLQITIPPPLTLSLPQSAVLQNASSNSAVGAGGGSQSVTSSLIAQQQQAHYIAQHSLMARQQAAAAAQLQAAQQQSDQMAFFQNFSFLQSPAGAGVNPGMPGNPYSYPLSPQMPQFYFLPRPQMLPMGLMPGQMSALGQMQYPGMHSAASYNQAMQAVQNANQIAGANATAQQSSSQIGNSSGKRSYESAFRTDPMNASTAKRAFHPNPGASNIYGTYPYPQL